MKSERLKYSKYFSPSEVKTNGCLTLMTERMEVSANGTIFVFLF